MTRVLLMFSTPFPFPAVPAVPFPAKLELLEMEKKLLKVVHSKFFCEEMVGQKNFYVLTH
jgi:hypothetical protein